MKNNKISEKEILRLEKITNFFLILEEKNKRKIEKIFTKEQIANNNLERFLIIGLKNSRR